MLIALSVNVEYTGTVADERHVAGGTGWFGEWWLTVWLLLFLIIVALHVFLYLARRRGDGSGPGDVGRGR